MMACRHVDDVVHIVHVVHAVDVVHVADATHWYRSPLESAVRQSFMTFAADAAVTLQCIFNTFIYLSV